MFAPQGDVSWIAHMWELKKVPFLREKLCMILELSLGQGKSRSNGF